MVELKIDEKQIVEAIICELKRHNIIEEPKSITIVYNSEAVDILYTVKEAAKLLKTNPAYVYELINAGHLPVLKLGSMKIRRVALLEFLEKFEGQDLTDPYQVKKLNKVDDDD